MNPVSVQQRRVVGDLTSDEFGELLAGHGLSVRVGPFDAHIHARVDGLYEPLYRLYHDYPLLDRERVFSFHVALTERRRYGIGGKRVVRFAVDGRIPHEDMPAEQALAVLEWGVNLAIALRAHRFVMLHAAALERGGKVLLMPASPGAGKTTLCVGLAHRGWRLFSDEFGLIVPGCDEMVPMPRPMPLKNESIDVIRAFAPDAELGPTIPNTRKGTIAHVRPPSASVRDAGVGAPVAWVIFPEWVKDSELVIDEISRAEGFMFLATNSFNYELRGEQGFQTLRQLIDNARCFRLRYSDLEEAIEALKRLADDTSV